MDSDLHHHIPPPQQIMNSGLTRYRSAPSSYFSNLINNGVYGDEDVDPFFNPTVSSPETERIFSRFGSGSDVNSNFHHNFVQIGGNEPQFLDSTNHEQEIYPSPSPQQQQQPTIYGKLAQSQNSGHKGNRVVSRSMDDPLMAMNPPTNLLRQSSSPAGFFDHINMDKGFSVTTSMDNSSFPSSKRLKTQMRFSSPSSSSPLSRIPETKGKTSFHGSSWDESTILTDSFLNELEESDQNAFSSFGSYKNHNNEERIHTPTTLTHHLSLPTSSSEVSAMENLLQFQDSVPLQSRAKRGCATHPRSIAERVRRTRISERMRKLQDLVLNMDKQTNTADVLDLAVDYIKELQKQVETLSERREKCTCRNEEKL